MQEDIEQKRQQELLEAYYAGFNQSHYSHIHPDIIRPKEMTRAAKEWYEQTYKRVIHIHHSGIIVENEGDEIYKPNKV